MITRFRKDWPWVTRAIFFGCFLLTFLCESLIVLAMRASPLMLALWACSGFRGAFHSLLGWLSLGMVLSMLLLSVVLPRCFCRFLCPQGTILAILRNLRSRTFRFLSTDSVVAEKPLPNVESTTDATLWENWRTWLIGVSRVKGVSWPTWRNFLAMVPWFSIGGAIAIVLIGNALSGRETKLLLVWTDPLVMLSAWRTDWNLKNVAMLLCLLIWLYELWRPGRWCRNGCPTGAVQDFLAIPIKFWNRWERNRANWPPPETSPNSEKMGCLKITGDSGSSEYLENRRKCGRYRKVYCHRPLLAMVMMCGWVVLLDRWGRRNSNNSNNSNGMAKPPKSFRLRPPGTVSERQFTSLCARCGNCATVCLTGLIYHPSEWPAVNQGDTPASNPLASEFHELGLPVLRFDPAYCEARCTACTEVCQTGALTPLTVEEKRLHPVGLATLDWPCCLLYEAHECRICVRECPQLAIEIVWSEAEYLPIPTINATLCTGCGRCLIACPAKCLTILPR